LTGPATAQEHPNTRLTLGDYIADVLINRKDRLRYYYIVQRIGSAEIIDMLDFDSFNEALIAAKEALQDWHRHDQSNVG
jgi:hypothetical protein